MVWFYTLTQVVFFSQLHLKIFFKVYNRKGIVGEREQIIPTGREYVEKRFGG